MSEEAWPVQTVEQAQTKKSSWKMEVKVKFVKVKKNWKYMQFSKVSSECS